LNIFAFLAECHYLVGVMILSAMAALVISIIYYNYNRGLRIFTYYIAFSLLQDMAAYYASAPFGPARNFQLVVFHVTTIAFMLFEFTVCNLYILGYVGSRPGRRFIRVSGLLFLGFLIFSAARNVLNFSDSDYAVPECVLLTISCLIYFYELFLTMNLRPLKDQAAFWVVTGILFVNACDIPLLLTIRFMRSYYDEVFSLNYILYTILFVLLIRAFLCPPEKDGRTIYFT